MEDLPGNPPGPKHALGRTFQLPGAGTWKTFCA